jgi:hypothetical protein
MPRGWHLRRGDFGLIAGREIFICASLVFLLFLRVGPPHLAPAPSTHLTITCDSHEQRPCFDHDGLQWLTPGSALSWPPLSPVSLCTLHSTDPPFVFEEGEFYYNRPPPPVS